MEEEIVILFLCERSETPATTLPCAQSQSLDLAIYCERYRSGQPLLVNVPFAPIVSEQSLTDHGLTDNQGGAME